MKVDSTGLTHVELTFQEAADLLAVLTQCWTGCCDATLDQTAFNTLQDQLGRLTLPEPSRVPTWPLGIGRPQDP
jgi:hypothetical protein